MPLCPGPRKIRAWANRGLVLCRLAAQRGQQDPKGPKRHLRDASGRLASASNRLMFDVESALPHFASSTDCALWSRLEEILERALKRQLLSGQSGPTQYNNENQHNCS